jgi:hypothetical protein
VAKPSRSDVGDALYSADGEVRHCGMRWRLIRRRRGCGIVVVGFCVFQKLPLVAAADVVQMLCATGEKHPDLVVPAESMFRREGGLHTYASNHSLAQAHDNPHCADRAQQREDHKTCRWAPYRQILTQDVGDSGFRRSGHRGHRQGRLRSGGQQGGGETLAPGMGGGGLVGTELGVLVASKLTTDIGSSSRSQEVIAPTAVRARLRGPRRLFAGFRARR